MRVWNKAAVMAAALTGMVYGAQAQMNPKEKLAAALKAIQDNYVDVMADEKLVDAAIAGMIRELDPHSRYFSREEALQMREAMSGSFTGIGIEYLMQRDSVYVTQVIPEGPADKKGLQPGDRIIAINGKSVAGQQISNYDIMKMLRGEKNTPVTLQIWRAATQAPFTTEIVRGAIPDKSVKAAYMVNDKTGYIALRIFNSTTRQEMDKALEELKAKGMQNLILDLQGNGGGYVEAAIGVADEFLKKDQLVFYSSPQDGGKDYYYTSGSGQFMEGKLVVMIDQNTASASEILSGALQDWDRAVLVGRRSFGKGLMQKPTALPDGSVMELTGARYFTPSGRSIQKPYHGAQYDDNVATRMASGELVNAGVVHFADSLKFTTLVSKRTVYGGGGIMPDKYVPIDTIEYNGWLQDVSDAGLVNKAVFAYIEGNRTALHTAYPQFTTFLNSFQLPATVVEEVVEEAQKAGRPLQPANAARLRNLLALEIKAQVARQLYSGNTYYTQVMNSDNESYRKALEIISDANAYNNYLPVVKPAAKKSAKK
ncbi:carboxyl-terminal processing protease [Filimonas zeae]|uniref:Peptidase S41 n=1 Tax=Filimonas zeae TaxID=1737353 RepID=A0A917MSK1_9BACT|nr:S41 family peptidase [Filimonas zeae]MDR6337964.1 carboxyl-terminal processing protease [Filimonas zeae]GGH61064.1 peptidase S41 [Filimonas zeae]